MGVVTPRTKKQGGMAVEVVRRSVDPLGFVTAMAITNVSGWDGWLFGVEFREEGYGVRVSQFAMSPPDQAFTARAAQSIPFARIVSAARERIEFPRAGEFGRVRGLTDDGKTVDVVAQYTAHPDVQARFRAAADDKTKLAWLAVRYEELVGSERSPSRVLAAEFGLTPEQVHERLRKARSLVVGFLTRPGPGRTGGDASGAREYLRSIGEEV